MPTVTFRSTLFVLASPSKYDDHMVVNERPSIDLNCPLCLYLLSRPKKLNPCGHNFCHSCIGQWFSIYQNCPLCRAPCCLRDIVQAGEEITQPLSQLTFKCKHPGCDAEGTARNIGFHEVTCLFNPSRENYENMDEENTRDESDHVERIVVSNSDASSNDPSAQQKMFVRVNNDTLLTNSNNSNDNTNIIPNIDNNVDNGYENVTRGNIGTEIVPYRSETSTNNLNSRNHFFVNNPLLNPFSMSTFYNDRSNLIQPPSCNPSLFVSTYNCYYYSNYTNNQTTHRRIFGRVLNPDNDSHTNIFSGKHRSYHSNNNQTNRHDTTTRPTNSYNNNTSSYNQNETFCCYVFPTNSTRLSKASSMNIYIKVITTATNVLFRSHEWQRIKNGSNYMNWHRTRDFWKVLNMQLNTALSNLNDQLGYINNESARWTTCKRVTKRLVKKWEWKARRESTNLALRFRILPEEEAIGFVHLKAFFWTKN